MVRRGYFYFGEVSTGWVSWGLARHAEVGIFLCGEPWQGVLRSGNGKVC